MCHPYLIRLIPKLLRELLESVEDAHSVPKGMIPVAHLVLDHSNIVSQECRQPWLSFCLLVDIVDALHERIVLVSNQENRF